MQHIRIDSEKDRELGFMTWLSIPQDISGKP